MKRYWLLSLLATVGIAAALWFAWSTWLREKPALPEIDVRNANPDLVKVIDDAVADVRKKPAAADAWGRLGMILLAHDYYPEASQCFAEAVKRDPLGARWLYYDSQALAKIYPRRAIDLLQKAVAIDGDDTTFRLFLGDLLMEQGRMEEAEGHYLRVVGSDKQKAWGHLRLARVAMRRDRPKEALAQVKLAQPGMRVTKELDVLLSEIHFRLGDAKAAELEYQKSLTLAPTTWPDPYMDEVQRLRTDVLGRLGQANQVSGEQDRQIAVLEEVLRANPESVPAHLDLARAYEKAKQWEAAAAVSSRALKLDPDSAVALNSLGFALCKQGANGREQAINIFKLAIQRNPHNADSHYWLGYCYEKQHQKPAAIEALREAVRLRPDFAGAWTVLGQLCSGDNDAEASACFQRALVLAPDDAVARNALDQLQKRHKK